ncbi:hypothetical protein [Tengunoibacter tsumagoiensis]|uniref:Uncharacterized protein n=1 Tax=Tengunoibacter tsumagoiensis TaxID=2014871 RepID=A0A402A9D8_9CHLR|nr:hypothetical protein [Tengunoibacter tsumagoiensis]GCE15760.1 hypothetical protein KTT_56190 [Tengunoibacter tsumagoiensis]
MDPVSFALITAISAGATNAVTEATSSAISTAYTALKTRLLEKVHPQHPKVPQALTELEASPASQGRQAVLVEEITATQLPQDAELVRLAQELLNQIKKTSASSQIIQQVKNSAVSNTGTANYYNIKGD